MSKSKEIKKWEAYLKNQLEFYKSLPKNDPYKASTKKHIEDIVEKIKKLKQ